MRQTQPIGRGAIVTYAETPLVLWQIGRNGVAFGLPVTPQTRPLHRAQVALSPEQAGALGLKRLASIIDTDAHMIAWRSSDVLGYCDEILLTRIGTAIRRSREAAQFERRHTSARLI